MAYTIKARTEEDKRFLRALGPIVMSEQCKMDHWGHHQSRVGVVTHRVARVLGLSEQECEDFGIAGYLHDMGKQGNQIKHLFVRRKGKYTPEERKLAATHTDIGAKIILYRFKEHLQGKALEIALDGASSHHLDFSAHGNKIPLVARIIKVVDFFDACVYRRRMSVDKALAHTQAQSGTMFDPQVVKALTKVTPTLKSSRPIKGSKESGHQKPFPFVPTPRAIKKPLILS